MKMLKKGKETYGEPENYFQNQISKTQTLKWPSKKKIGMGYVALYMSNPVEWVISFLH